MKQRRKTYQKMIIANRVYLIISHINQTTMQISNRNKLLEGFYMMAAGRMKFCMAGIGQADQIQEYPLPSGSQGSN
jgi:hypothetical protein